MTSIRLAVPDTATLGEVIEIKALIQHPMESGFRRGSRGEVIERNIIIQFECQFEDETVFSATFHPAIAANPILTFNMRVTQGGTLGFTWTDQHGESWSDQTTLTVA
ncbi:MAG: thiosulfate oxidation carrier complex protein SoxZ [Pseudomonadota bacterium]